MRRILFLFLVASSLSADPIVIRSARVIDGRGHVFTNAAVVVDGHSIVRIDEKPSRVTYDLGDATVMPGGIDTHVHIGWHFDADGRSHDDETDRNESPQATALFAAENAYKTLMGGITTA